MAIKKPAAKKVVATKAPAKKTATKKTVEPTPKTAKRKLSDKTINKTVDAMTPKKPAAKKAPAKAKLTVKEKTAKEIATEAGEPYVSVLQVELDPDNIGNGAFELDWNDKFIANLVRAGYKGKDDVQMVDQWFQDVCRNVLAENYEQWAANQPAGGRTNQRDDLGGGKTSVS